MLYDTYYTERYMGLPGDNAAGYNASKVFWGLDKLRCDFEKRLCS